MDTLTIIEIAATIFGFASVYLTVKENIWCWPTGLIMVSLYIIIFYHARLYSDMGLQVVYIFMQFYGWYFWMYGRNRKKDNKKKVKIVRLKPIEIAMWGIIAIIGTYALGYIMNTYTNADYAFADAFTTTLSLIAQWFLSRKILESWVLWITVDVVSITLYGLKGLYFTTGLYTAFLVLATMGLIQWYKTHKARDAHKIAPQAV
jgi:nicotinamide mononucleotide transporter